MAQEKSTEYISATERAIGQGLVNFINASPSPYHAVQTCEKILRGEHEKKKSDETDASEAKFETFTKLDETDTKDWSKLEPGRYYFTRNQSTIVAFIKPKNFKPGNGFTIMGAHTDSPAFRVKPISKKTKENYLMVGVEKYGWGLWHTWFDRDLSVAGRVMLDTDNGAVSRLVRIDKPILRMANLAIHLTSRADGKAFKFDVEDHTVPIFATCAAAELNETKCGDISEEHHPLLLRLIADELEVDVKSILDFELYLFDTQPGVIGGGLDEFIFCPRLDNLGSTYSILTALVNSFNKSLDGTNIRMIASFDNEEIGNDSNRGAGSNLLYNTMKRIHGDDLFDAAVQKSILISCDMEHAIHPNYASKHETNHKPEMGKGLVIKYNCNQEYATSMVSTYHLIQIAKENGIPLQKFVIRNNIRCGFTIGPELATNCGIRTVDVGCPQLSMHSIREQCGVKDIATSTELFTKYFENFVRVDNGLKVD